jgi:hypothetical protein
MLVAHWQSVWQRRKSEMLRRFETIARMNDSIRNALQAIQFVDYAANSGATESVQNAVRTIDSVLKEVLSEAHPSVANRVHLTPSNGGEQVRITSLSAFCRSEVETRCEGVVTVANGLKHEEVRPEDRQASRSLDCSGSNQNEELGCGVPALQ